MGFARSWCSDNNNALHGRAKKMVRFDQIVPNPDVVPYPRLGVVDTTRLARSIQNKGLQTPLLVWAHEGNYILVDGYRRYEALERVKATNRLYWRRNFMEVEVELVEGDITDALIAQAKANGQTWNDADFACAAAAMESSGMSAAQISDRTGESACRILDAIEFRQSAVRELVEAVADGYPYEEARELAHKPEEVQRSAERAFRHGKPRKERRAPREKAVDLGPVKIRPRRKTVAQIGEAADAIEEHLQDVVNDEVATLHAMSAKRNQDSERYLRRRTRKIDELRAMRHTLLFILGKRPDLLEIEDPVDAYERGRHGQWFKMPSWRDERRQG